MDRTRATTITAIAVVVLVGGAAPAWAAKDETVLVSIPTLITDGPTNASSSRPSVSADGRYIAFESNADNLSAIDNDSVTNVFVRDTVANTTTLISRESGANGSTGAAASSRPSISADGRYIAFASNADNLSTADNNSVENVFVRDTVANTTTLISRQSAADGGTGASGSSFKPSISADGRYIAFSSFADNLSNHDNDVVTNVFVHDTAASTTTLISRQSTTDGGTGASANSDDPSISADGRYVAFESNADNLSTADNNSVENAFVRDTVANTTTLISRQSAADGGTGASANSFEPSVSADGRHIAFQSAADNLTTADNNSVTNLFVRDTATNTTTLISRQSTTDGGTAAADNSYQPSISADGRHIAFRSYADNLSTADDNSVENVFVRDTAANTTTLISRQSAADGATGADGFSDEPSVSADGRYIVFESDADNLSAVDNNGVQNLFLRDVLGPPPPPPPAPMPASMPPSESTPVVPTAAGGPAAVVPAPLPRLSGSSIRLTSARSCVSRRSLAVTLRRQSGVTYRSAKLTLKAGKKTITRTIKPKTRNGKTTVAVNLKGLPRGRFTVKISITTTDGRTATARRTYRTCTAKRR